MMAKGAFAIPLLNKDGKRVGESKLEILNFRPIDLEATGYQVIKAHLASSRSGTASTKTRAEVRGGGQKPWRQKGTGRARAGSTRAPHWTGGGTVFGPKPRDFGFELPRKMRRKALAQALLNTIENQDVVTVKKMDIKEGKTAKAVELLNNLKIGDNKTLVILDDESDMEVRAFRNLRNVKTIKAKELNLYDIYWCSKVIIKEEALEDVKKMMFV